ncbi:MAG: class I SAM-dependent methyltransferase [Oligoflexales bacterium]|nr:class I SAM-dependent methyltransferase [Oligoflexales bacterium]
MTDFDSVNEGYLHEMANSGYVPEVEGSYQQLFFPKVFKELEIDKNGSFLDLGTAQGHVPITMHKYGYKNWSVIDCTDIYFGRFTNMYGFSCNKVDLLHENFPFPDQSFDLITMCELIEHLSDPFLALKESLRCLKNNGTLIITTPDYKKVGAYFYEDPTHIRPFISEGLQRTLKIAGFMKPEVRNWGIGTQNKFDLVYKVKNKIYNRFPGLFNDFHYTGTHLIAFAKKI